MDAVGMVLSLEWPFQEQSVRRAKLPQTLEFKDGIASFILRELVYLHWKCSCYGQELVCSSDKDPAAFFSEAEMTR